MAASMSSAAPAGSRCVLALTPRDCRNGMPDAATLGQGRSNAMISRIAVMGAGAIGSVVGGMLTRAGRDVTLIDQWPAHVVAMQAHGLRLSGTCGEHVVPVKALHLGDAQAIGQPFDAIFL